MSLDGLSAHVPSVATNESSESPVSQEREARAIIEGDGIHEFVPPLLLKLGVRGATRKVLEDGRSEISAPAPTTREKLFAALARISGIRLAVAQ
jgi:hypothetical protein